MDSELGLSGDRHGDRPPAARSGCPAHRYRNRPEADGAGTDQPARTRSCPRDLRFVPQLPSRLHRQTLPGLGFRTDGHRHGVTVTLQPHGRPPLPGRNLNQFNKGH